MDLARHEKVRGWQTSSQYRSQNLNVTLAKFHEVTDLLLERPNLNSSHLFRADIISDSASKLRTIFEKDRLYDKENGEESKCRFSMDTMEGSSSNIATLSVTDRAHSDDTRTPDAPSVDGYQLDRTVVRMLIPRKPQVDRPLKQSCFIYIQTGSSQDSTTAFVVYAAHVDSEDQIPWYYPPIKTLAYQYEHDATGDHISIHFQTFSNNPSYQVPERMHRTFLSLLQTFVRLSKFDPEGSKHSVSADGLKDTSGLLVNPLRDAILPQHRVQDTYTRLKETYASDLISRWVEKTEPSKHVFEDLSIAAFLIELWKTMYNKTPFPGFIDIACGNGVLVYILIKEGYSGSGFDARRRRTWHVLDIDEHLHEKIYIPQPFLDVLSPDEISSITQDTSIHSGNFDPGTFIISNHADELTLWTPLLATLASPAQPLPFLAIPCCSHALSGVRYRYPLKDLQTKTTPTTKLEHEHENDGDNDQPKTGSLKTLRGQQAWSCTHADDKSAYACLTKKTVALAAEVGFDTEMTLMRIPSTRNIGIVGRRYSTGIIDGAETRLVRVGEIVRRECATAAGGGGVDEAARIWVDRARKLVDGAGRGKINLGRQKSGSNVERAGGNALEGGKKKEGKGLSAAAVDVAE